MKKKRTQQRVIKPMPEIWYLIRSTEGTLSTEALQTLQEASCHYIDLDDFQAKHNTHTVVAAEFNSKYAHTILVHCQQDTLLTITSTPYFQKVWSGPHAGRSCLTLSGHGAEQIQMLLRIQDPSPIEVIRQGTLPIGGTWKKCSIQQGQLQGLEGQVFCDRANQRKFWFRLLPQLLLQFRIPAPLLHKPKWNEEKFTQEATDNCYWFMVSCRTAQHLTYAFGKEEEPLHYLDPTSIPDDHSTICTIYHPEYIERFSNGQEKRKPVFPRYFFIHTTLSHIETFRYQRPDSHVYVMRDNRYRPIRIRSQEMKTFIYALDRLNGIIQPDEQELISLLQPGDYIQYQLHPSGEPLFGGIKQIKGKTAQFILITTSGLVTIHQENIVLNEHTKQQLETRKS